MLKNRKYLTLVDLAAPRNIRRKRVGEVGAKTIKKSLGQLRERALKDLSDLTVTVQDWEKFYLCPSRNLSFEEWQDYCRAAKLKQALLDCEFAVHDNNSINRH